MFGIAHATIKLILHFNPYSPKLFPKLAMSEMLFI